ncbi:hypothetical protein [Salmonella enterica]|uniref:Lipoprotein n=1 Tax=Salmonella enterica subsp. enterica serovar Abeokuta TaxID=2926665 RepID=A0A8T9IEH2_SALET|nr:hypothetical protein [Salmonella enterica]EBL5546219.1 hypothetical protein [Salmonella enterica subsp. enterica serovar Schwarzengrund]ECC9617847.1 hypothetical protein [Salmonella enterica subsp. enterica]EDW2628626.1 hypothetical protein [Salmonella enterica subsp. enterica serovar Sangalkam]EGA8861400.1 hypothetical protein [Salmonella enterica subsp. enterica serovar Orion]HBJ6904504.1 hypothetical protein [Salmonella enterica subsp. enterica serovar Wyldegreen]
MSKIARYFFILLTFPTICLADCIREANSCSSTRLGLLEQQSGAESSDGYSHLTLNGVEMYKTKTDLLAFNFDDDGVFKNKKYFTTKTIFTFIPAEPCRHKEYYGYCRVSVVLDFSGDKPVISNEFISDSGSSVIDWVSWGKANAIIVFEDGSKFKYMNGHVERVIK